MIFLLGDSHFGHANIIKYCNRPFASVEEMNTEMISRWNKVVATGDTVYHLGDFSFYTGHKWEQARKICQQLNGFKILIRGNHDDSAEEMMDKVGFHAVLESAIVKFPHLGKCLLTHHPYDVGVADILSDLKCKFQIHGHVHNGEPLFPNQYRINVSCENTNYAPINTKALAILLKK